MVAMGDTATARGLLKPRLIMVAMDTVDMVVMATARGLLMPMPTMVATDTADMGGTATARGLLMPMPTMVATDTVDMAATAMARGLLTLTMVAMDMVATLTASNLIDQENHTPKKPFSKSKFLQSFTLDLSNHYLGLNQ